MKGSIEAASNGNRWIRLIDDDAQMRYNTIARLIQYWSPPQSSRDMLVRLLSATELRQTYVSRVYIRRAVCKTIEC